jgi:ParB/RepB/Spo0J family partition protein
MEKISSSETTASVPSNSTENLHHDEISEPALTNDTGAYTLIPLELIDEPSRAIRSTFDTTQLAELAMSISDVGLIQPLVVERNGERFRVIAGHRRLVACQIAKYSPVACLVREPGQVDPAAVKLAENYYREAVNPAEEAAFLHELLNTRCGGDTDVLAALIKHPRSYVEDRLLLLRGDPGILEALKHRQISLGVARELNRVTDPNLRLIYLDAASRGGATVQVVRNWRTQEYQPAPQASAEDGTPAAAGFTPATAAAPAMVCLFCADSDEPERMEHVWLHRHCRRYVEKILNVGAAAAAAADIP